MKGRWIQIALLFFVLPTIVVADGVSSRELSRYKKALRVYLKNEDEFELESLVEKLGEADDPKAVVLIPIAATGMPSAKVWARARKAIEGLENDKAVDALVKLVGKLKTTSYQQGVLIIEAFGGRDDAASLEVIVGHLDHKMAPLRLAAIRAAKRRKDKAPIPGLIGLLEKYAELRNLTWLESREALITLTGRDFEAIEDWKKFWDAEKDNIDPKNLEETKGSTKVAIKKGKDAVEFFGAEIFSRNLVFVIDVSGSMMKYDDSDDYEGSNVETDRERLHRARQQLESALTMLPKTARFNIIAFNNAVKMWQKGLRPASRSSVKSAVKFVRGFKALSATHTDEALERAFADLNVDTIVLLSDGAPMKQGATDAPRLIKDILKWVKNHNASRKVRINTFGFDGVGEYPERAGGRMPPTRPEDVRTFVEFMKKLAEENGGAYRSVQ